MTNITHIKTETVSTELISPYGGKLVDLFVNKPVDEFRDYASHLHSVQLSERQACDLELMVTGAFSPLNRFMGQADHISVLRDMRLTNGYLFPISVTLSVVPDRAIHLDQDIALRDSRNELLAIMTIEEVYEWDLSEEASAMLCTDDPRHPLVAEMFRWGKLNISGPIQAIKLPRHYDFQELRLTPSQTRARLEDLGHKNVIAFQTRNPLHRAHEELTKRAIQELDGVLLLHPAVGMTKPGDVDHYTRVRTYVAMAAGYYDSNRILLSLLPLAMRLAGPREALWHALIRRNYGASHMIIGRDHASPGTNSMGQPFYQPYDAQALVQQFSEELGISVLAFNELVYIPDEDRYEELSKLSGKSRTLSLSGSQVRDEYLQRGKTLPGWFTRPEVAAILEETHPPRHKQGVCVWFTGLSCAGKSTTAEILTELLLENGRQVTLMDGDVVRTHLSQGLGFSKEDRDINVRRIGYVAAEIVRHGGAVICAAVSPYRATRNDARNMVGDDHFIEVFVDTPLEVCEQRDTKGMYAKARRGELTNFTGVSDVYEIPQDAELVLDAVGRTPEENALLVLDYLERAGLIRKRGPMGTSPTYDVARGRSVAGSQSES
jgi:sulfate adenylyltransferase